VEREDSVSLRFLYAKDEYVRGARIYLFKIKSKLDRYGVVAAPLLLVGSASYINRYGTGVFAVTAAVLSVVAIVMETALYFYVPTRYYGQISEMGEYRLTFTREGITFKTESVDSNLKWDIYSEMLENDDFYFLVQRTKNFTLLPKRVFADAAERDMFVKIALGAVGSVRRI
jgi:hypothetical protein